MGELEHGLSGGSGGTTLHWNVTFGFPTVPGRTASEYLTFTTAAARGGGTAVRVDVQTIWVIPRPTRLDRAGHGG
jgi:hypothetical protein